ncbi:hypothetical protein ACQ86N_32865 [Puia sp. P3]|uniref:hypothetical protein n=1 Tax=Puia sp. P3 TaxID=3423952 RepID=UPI003D66A4B1
MFFGTVEVPAPVGFEAYGVEVVAVLKDGDGRIVDRQVFAVVDDGGEAVEQVLVDAPLGAEVLGDFQDGLDVFLVGAMDIVSPLAVVGVAGVAEGGEEVEIEVVVGVDEAGEQGRSR